MISKSELKFIRSLKIKKYRTAEKCFLVEGEKNVLELLSSDYNLERLYVTLEFQRKFSTVLAKIPHQLVSEKELESASALSSNDQALAVARMKDHRLQSLDQKETIIVLDGVNDPGNLGTIIRTMDWFGLNQLVCSVDTVDFYNPKAIQASMGSFTRMNIVYADLSGFLSNYKGRRVGADISGVSLGETSLSSPIAIVMGSESHGIRPEVRKTIDEFVTIPKVGNAESLNVGIAMGIICHHIVSH